jgi:hypothetical protein
MNTLSHLANVLVPRLINMVVAGLILGLIYWLVSMIPLPEPYKNAVNVFFLLIAVLILLSILVGGQMFIM